MRLKTKISLILLGGIAAGLIAISVAAEPPPLTNPTGTVTADGNIFQALSLGLVQGITEFLPISSTAHLLITTKVFGWQQLGQKDYADAIQLGSVFAVFIYFWKDISNVVAGKRRRSVHEQTALIELRRTVPLGVHRAKLVLQVSREIPRREWHRCRLALLPTPLPCGERGRG